MKRTTLRLGFLALLGLPMTAMAASEGSISTANPGSGSSRVEKPLSISVGINNPAPTLVGVNASYSINDSFRATLGYGELTATTSLEFNGSTLVAKESKISTYGIGAEYTVPGWSLTPVVGLKAAYVSYTGQKGIKVGGFEESGGHAYTNLGLDWQASGGFNMGLGYNLSFNGGEASGAYLNMGWAFDWLKL